MRPPASPMLSPPLRASPGDAYSPRQHGVCTFSHSYIAKNRVGEENCDNVRTYIHEKMKGMRSG